VQQRSKQSRGRKAKKVLGGREGGGGRHKSGADVSTYETTARTRAESDKHATNAKPNKQAAGGYPPLLPLQARRATTHEFGGFFGGGSSSAWGSDAAFRLVVPLLPLDCSVSLGCCCWRRCFIMAESLMA
jgi:hypothetical protein